MTESVYIAAGARTPMGGLQGCFSDLTAVDLGAAARLHLEVMHPDASRPVPIMILDLERFLAMAPQHESVPQVERLLEKLRRKAAQIH